jgi:hypothetical protein
MKTMHNDKGIAYYAKKDDQGRNIYSFTENFDDTWTDEDRNQISVFAPQLLTIRSIISEARQTLDGKNPIKAVGLYEIADGLHSLDVLTWHPNTETEENHANLALQALQNLIIAKGIACKLEKTDRNMHQCLYVEP